MRFNPRAITVSALPARTGIVELMLLYPKLPAGPPLGRKLSLRAKPNAAGAAGPNADGAAAVAGRRIDPQGP